MTRTRPDRCPGVSRPWPAEDGLLIRIRLVGGAVTRDQLLRLADVAARFGDGRVHVTNRANLQVRAFSGTDGRLTDEALEALQSTGLVGPLDHDLVRNIMLSPGQVPTSRADLRPVVTELDQLVCANEVLASLPGKFLFCLDDGRGDLVDHWCDLGLVALDDQRGQLRIGTGWGQVVQFEHAARLLAWLAVQFVDARGTAPTAAWHVEELDAPFVPTGAPDPDLPQPSGALPFGDTPAGRHVEVPDEGLDRAGLEELCGAADQVVVTPWHGVLVPGGAR